MEALGDLLGFLHDPQPWSLLDLGQEAGPCQVQFARSALAV